MPLFRYEALSGVGKKIGGTLDADSLRDAKLKLIRGGVAVLKIAPLSEKEVRGRLKKGDVLLLTKELARLLQAGLPLFEALSALEEKHRGGSSHAFLLDMRDRVRSGQPFSQALMAHSRSFGLLYTSMIANAEKTGRLGPALEELAQLLTRQQQIRKQILSALLYPALLFSFCLVVLSSLLFFVVPSLRELFEERENLHPFTRAVFVCSEIACNSKGALLLFFVLLAALIGGAFFLPSWKKKIVSILLKAPFLKKFFAKVALVRFCRAAATLLEGGVPLITTLSQARSVMRHPILEAAIARAEERIAQGEPLSVPFTEHPLIPPLVPRMLAIAEQSGKLSFTMQQIAQIYEDELETALSHFATVAQPALLLFLGALVGFVLLSVLMPLTDVSSFAN